MFRVHVYCMNGLAYVKGTKQSAVENPHRQSACLLPTLWEAEKGRHGLDLSEASQTRLP